ncbi:MAG: hypothetical protein Q4G28_01940 [Neisseria sp.]|nr:hypothetical protein [Neisseria sp.]
MIWEFIAIISAGLGAAGIALLLRIFFKRLPKWLVPAAAGIGMIGFQVYSEYNWYGHTRSLLPASAVVVAEVPQTAFYKPWSYVKPQILKFIAVDTAKTTPVGNSDNILQTNLYFFERRMSAHTLPVLVDCQNRMQAYYHNESGAAAEGQIEWGKTGYTDKLADAVCPKPA